MAENEKKPEGLTSISDDEAITEIDFSAFLSDGDDNSAVIDGLHDDIEKTEKNLDDAIQNLYDSIMKSTPETIVPRTIDDITAKADDASPLGDMWMSPDEYIDIPVSAPQKPPLSKEETAQAKDDIMGMIDSLKSNTDSAKGFEDILAGIESNSNIAPVSTEFSEASKLADPDVKLPEDLDSELDSLLGNDKNEAEEAQSSLEEAKSEYLGGVTGEDNSFYSGSSLPELKATDGLFPDDIDADDDLPLRERKKAERAAKKAEKEALKSEDDEAKSNKKEIIRKIVLTVSIITIIISGAILVNTYIIEPYKFKKNQKEIADIVSTDSPEDATAVIEEKPENDKYPKGMLAKYAKLYDINSDLAGWVSIPEFDINLPIVQGKDNDYYLKRNFYKKWTDYGVPFFDYRIKSLETLPRNTVVYGHNMRYDDKIFGMLEDYYYIDGFKKAPVIQCDSIYGSHTWFVYAVFITNSAKAQDNGYLFPYNFIELGNAKFMEYIKEIDKRKLYTTGVDITATDNILTLSTCCYDFEGARFVIVAREKRDGESSTVDTSGAFENPNPRYPQAWYNAYKKTNPYANDSNWGV